MFFVVTGFSGFALALVSLSFGLLLDTGRVPFRVWSLICCLMGGCLVIGAGQAAAAIYRLYRRRVG